MADEPAPRLKLKLVRSVIGGTQRQRATVKALGLRKMHQVVEHPDSAVTRGMVLKVAHLVSIIEEH
jgi:large subunit ribosomal protein L30